VTIIGEANKAGISIVVFYYSPFSDKNPALVVANNYTISYNAMKFMARQAVTLGKKRVKLLLMVGDLGDPNVVEGKRGLDDIIEKYPKLFEKPVGYLPRGMQLPTCATSRRLAGQP